MTWRLCKMNLAMRGIEGQIAHGRSFHNERRPDLKADYGLANSPFNDSDRHSELLKDDKRWFYGVLRRDLVRAWRAAKDSGEVVHG